VRIGSVFLIYTVLQKVYHPAFYDNNSCPISVISDTVITVLLHVLGQLLVFSLDLAVLLFYNCIQANVHTVVLLGK